LRHTLNILILFFILIFFQAVSLRFGVGEEMFSLTPPALQQLRRFDLPPPGFAIDRAFWPAAQPELLQWSLI